MIIKSAQGIVNAQRSISLRDLVKRQEEAHGWLCCLAGIDRY
jgi:hypothetical protein